MDERTRAFLENNHAAAMITLRKDGTPHTARVGVALVDGKLWSSGTQTRLRTKHLRRDPRCTLFVFPTAGAEAVWQWLALETTVTILEGDEAPQLNLRLMREMQRGMTPAPEPGKVVWFGQQLTEAEFLVRMVQEQRLVYEFGVTRTYGMF